MISDIKRKSFTVSKMLTDKQVLAPDFTKTFIGACNEISPLMKFLAASVGVPW